MKGTGRETIVAASALVMGGTFLAAVTEFGRDIVIAAIFGGSAEADAFFGAMIIPSIFVGILVYAGKVVFVPLFTAITERDGGEEGARLVGSIVLFFILIILTFCAMGALLAGPVVRLTLPRLSGDLLPLAVYIQRVFYLFLFLSGAAICFSSHLYSIREFFVPSFMQALLNIVLISAMLLLAPAKGVSGAAAAFCLGAAAQLALVTFASRKKGFKPGRPSVRLRGELRALSILVLMPVLLMSVRSLNQVVDRAVASYLAEGSIAAITYASRIVFGFRAVIAGSIFTAGIPFIAALLARREIDRVKLLVESGVKGNLLVMIPVSIFLMLLSHPIISLLYERGAFMPADTVRTATALFWFATGLLPAGLILIIVSPFFAARKPLVPIANALVMFVLNASLTVVLALRCGFGIAGIAAASSLTFFCSSISVAWFLRRRLGGFLRPGFALYALKIVAASALSGWIARLAYGILAARSGLFVTLGVSGVLFAFTYLLTLKALRLPELDRLTGDALRLGGGLTRLIFPGRPGGEPGPDPFDRDGDQNKNGEEH